MFDGNEQQGETTKLAKALLKGIRRGYANELDENRHPENNGLDISWINSDDSLPRGSNIDLQITEDGCSIISSNDCLESLDIRKEANVIYDEKVFYEKKGDICSKLSAFASPPGTHGQKEAESTLLLSQDHLQHINDNISSGKSAISQHFQCKILAKQKKPDQLIYQPKVRSPSGDIESLVSGEEFQNKDSEQNSVHTSTNVRDTKSKKKVAVKKFRNSKKNNRKQKKVYRSNPELNVVSPVGQTKDSCAKSVNQCSPFTTDSSTDWDKINSD